MRRHRSPLSFAVLPFVSIGLVALVACGSTAAKGSSPDAACDALYAAVCDQLAACSPAFPILDGDRDACVARRSAACKATYLGPGSTESQAALEACFNALAPTSCDAVAAFLFENFALPPACDGLHGRGERGTPCAAPDQCGSAVCAENPGYTPDDVACGQCGGGLTQGAFCNDETDCAPGLTCAKQACAPYAELGEACDASHLCHRSARCVGGSCAALAAAGEACVQGQASCALDLDCNAKTSTCRPPLVGTGTAGGTCGLTGDGDEQACAHGYTCVVAASGIGACYKLANEGEDCLTGPCAAPLRCIDGACRLQSAAACQ